MTLPKQNGDTGARCFVKPPGFAIIICLVMISFLTLLIAVLLQLTQQMNNDRVRMRTELLARQHAKVALSVAIGQLYKIASEDARAIAPLQMINEQAPHGWLGVWDTSANLSEPAFLGSLVSDDPLGASVPRVLFSEDSEHEDIYAEEIGINEGGAYAYYISDESMKVQVGTGDRGFESFESPVEKSPFVYQRSGLGAYFELLNPGVSEDEFYPIDPRSEEDLNFTNRIENLDLLNLAPAASGAGLRYSEQDITMLSLGLLTRTDGEPGFLQDLSLDPGLLGPGLESWLDYTSYMHAPSEDLPIGRTENDPRRLFKMRGYSDMDPGDGDFVHVIAPIITDFGIQFSARNHASDPITGEMRMVLELWNPYTQALAFEEMEIRVRGIPKIEIIPVNNPEDPLEPVIEYLAESFEIDPMKIFGESIPEGDDAIVVRLDNVITPAKSLVSAESAEARYWPPGRLLYWVGKNNHLASSRADDGYGVFGTRNSKDARFSIPIEPTMNWPSVVHNKVRYRIDSSELSVELRLRSDDSILQKLDSFEFLDVDSDYLDKGWQSRYATFQARRLERGNVMDHSDRSVWIRSSDPRGIDASFGFDPQLNNYTTRGGALPSPLEFPFELATKHYVGKSNIEDNRFLFDREISNVSNSPYLGMLYDPIVFDIPTRKVLSVGELQHAYIAGYPLYSIGNQWGGLLNDVFDRYFFSGQNSLSNSSEDSSVEMHPILRAKRGVSDKENIQPEDLFVSWRFNVNSLNREAWLGALSSGSPDDLIYHQPDGNLMDDIDSVQVKQAKHLPPIITRFPFSMSAWMGVDPLDFRSEATDPPIQFFHEGYKIFGERLNGSSDIESAYQALDISLASQLGAQIVQELEGRGKPIMRLRDLVVPDSVDEESVLERALSRVPELRQQIFNNDGGFEEQAVDPLLPAYTLPSDVMSLIAPVASVRGDTFRIRTYGAAEGIDNYYEKYCEAVVQRMPETVEGSSLKRKYELVSFRWIESTDL